MKKLMNYLSMMLIIGGLAFVASCGTDDDPIIDVGTGTVLVGDGFYITNSSSDPTSGGQLNVETVEEGDTGSQDRDNYFATYAFLEAGDYNVVNVLDKAITETYGGSASTVSQDVGNCTPFDYTLVTSTLDGAAFSVANTGVYKVTFDKTTSEIVLVELTVASLIGPATTIGWAGDQTVDLTGGATATGAAWSGSDLTLRQGSLKLRFNCGWKVTRPEYTIFLNFGADAANGVSGSTVNLATGNDDAAVEINATDGNFPNEGVYTVKVDFATETGIVWSLERTGDAVAAATYPDVMYLVGAATAYGWDTPSTAVGAEMHKIDGGSVVEEGIYWKILHLEAGMGFKVSEANWGTVNLGHGDIDEYDANGVTVTAVDGNMDIAASGMYMVVLNLQNDTKKLSVIAPSVYGMGDGAFTSWDEDAAAHLFTVDDVAKTLTSPALSGTGGIRSYASHAWIPAWWNAEFVPNAGTIEYRNDSGADPSAQTAAVGNTITYSFDDNTSSIQ